MGGAIIFDIETGPQPLDKLQAIFDRSWQPPPHPGEFDPASVKYGNTKDEAKRAEKLREARESHAAAVARHEATAAKAREDDYLTLAERAALDPATGQVLAIGIVSTATDPVRVAIKTIDEQCSEVDLLQLFWGSAAKWITEGRKVIGHSIFGFDLPFLVRRSWILRVDVPASVRKNSRYWADQFVDTRECWQCGDRQAASSLDHVARSLDCGGKPDDVSGADFARLFAGSPEERAKAIEYLRNDLSMTLAVAERMGLLA